MPKKLSIPRLASGTYITQGVPLLIDQLITKRWEEKSKKNPGVRCQRLSQADILNEGIILLLKKEGLIKEGDQLW